MNGYFRLITSLTFVLIVKAIVLHGVEPNIGAEIPLKKPPIPSPLIVPPTVPSTVAFDCTCILTLMVSKGCEVSSPRMFDVEE